MGRRSLKLPPGCKRYVDHTGVVRTYYRHTRPPTPLPGLPWSVEFMQAYDTAKACAGRDKPLLIGAARTKAGSLNAALVKYYGSDEFTAMTKDVSGQNRGFLEKWRIDRGDRPLRQLQHEHVQGYINHQATPTVQRNVLRAIRHFLKFCLKHSLVDGDASAGVIKSKIIQTGGFRVWTEDDVAKYIARWPLGTTAHLALQIMLCTSLRRSDAIEIGPRHVARRRASARRARRLSADEGPAHRWPPRDGAAASRSGRRDWPMPVIGTETFLITDHGKPFGERVRQRCANGATPLEFRR